MSELYAANFCSSEKVQEARDLLNTLVATRRYTPDFHHLVQQRHHRVFVYGTLKKDFKRHNLLRENAVPVGRAFTVESNFEMYRTKGADTYPVCIQSNVKSEQGTGHILGEVYVVPAWLIAEMDMVETNGHLFHREKKVFKVFPLCGDCRPVAITAFVYLGKWTEWLAAKNRHNIVYCDRKKSNGFSFFNYEKRYESYYGRSK